MSHSMSHTTDGDNDLLLCERDHEVAELRKQLARAAEREMALRAALDLIRSADRWEGQLGGRIFTGFIPPDCPDGCRLDPGQTADYFLTLIDRTDISEAARDSAVSALDDGGEDLAVVPF